MVTIRNLWLNAPDRNLFDASISGLNLSTLPFGNIPKAVQIIVSNVHASHCYMVVEPNEFKSALKWSIMEAQERLSQLVLYAADDEPDEVDVTTESELTVTTNVGERRRTNTVAKRTRTDTNKTTMTSKSEVETEPATHNKSEEDPHDDVEVENPTTDTVTTTPKTVTKSQKFTAKQKADRLVIAGNKLCNELANCLLSAIYTTGGYYGF